MKGSLWAVTAVLATVAVPVGAAEVEALLKSKECLTCHSIDRETAAPSFQSIGRKYKGNENAEAMLMATVMKGSPSTGGFHWGTRKMPSPSVRQAVSEEEAKQVVGWILGL
jgi:cytochrome c